MLCRKTVSGFPERPEHSPGGSKKCPEGEFLLTFLAMKSLEMLVGGEPIYGSVARTFREWF